jgi:protein-disulfide isomerase
VGSAPQANIERREVGQRTMNKTEWVSQGANVLLAICAVVVTVAVVRKEFFSSRQQERAPVERTMVADWRTLATAGHRTGPDDASVEIVVFSDFQCPACRSLAQRLKIIRGEFPEVAVVHRHAPLRRHTFAVAAASAADCAAEQGRFDAFHDALFARQSSIGFTPWSDFAESAGVPDIPAFEGCIASDGAGRTLARDTVDARRLNVVATPTFLVNGRQFTGTPPLDTLRAYVWQAEASIR